MKTKLRAQVADLGEEGWDQYFGWELTKAYYMTSEDPISEFQSWTPLLIIPGTVMIVLIIFRYSLSKQNREVSAKNTKKEAMQGHSSSITLVYVEPPTPSILQQHLRLFLLPL